MATTTKTIDERIREKARKELLQNIDAAFLPATRMIGSCGQSTMVAGYAREEGRPAYASDNMAAIKKAVFSALVDSAEERAVAEFIQQVDTLQDQLNDIRHDISN